MEPIRIENHGPLIVATNYWSLPAAGKFFMSINAGAFRLLVPRIMEAALADLRTGREVIVSRGPWPAERQADALELLFEDGTDSPFSLILDVRSLDRLPVPEDAGRGFVFSAWIDRRGRPHKSLERPAFYRVVQKLPCLLPWARKEKP